MSLMDKCIAILDHFEATDDGVVEVAPHTYIAYDADENRVVLMGHDEVNPTEKVWVGSLPYSKIGCIEDGYKWFYTPDALEEYAKYLEPIGGSIARNIDALYIAVSLIQEPLEG